MSVVSVMSDLASFGAAGLMGAMWLWERKLSRTRERQINSSHARIMRDEQRLESLTHVVEQNTTAVTRFSEAQREVCETIKHLLEEFHHERYR